MRSRVFTYYAMSLLAVIISFNVLQVWHNGWAHTSACETLEVQEHTPTATDADCLLCTLFFAATNTDVVVWSALIVSVAFVAAAWQSVSIEVATLFSKTLRGPPVLMS